MPKQRDQDRRRRSESSEDRKEGRESRPRSRSPEESEDEKQKEEDHGKKKPEEEVFEEETESSSTEESSESEDKEKDPEHEPEEATASKTSEAAASKPARAPDSPMSSGSRRRLEEKRADGSKRRLEEKLAKARIAASQAALQAWAEEEKARKDKKEKKKEKMKKEKKEKKAKKKDKDGEEQEEKEADDKAKEADERPHDEAKEKKAWDGPKGPPSGQSKKCGVCWRWIQEHAAARRQHKLSVYHRTWKYIGQGLSKEAAAARAKRRFYEHWQPGKQEESEEESEVPNWELRRDSSNKNNEGYWEKKYGYGDVRGGSGPSGAKAHAQNEKGRPEQAKTKGSKKRKKPAEGETISLIETEDDKEDRLPVQLLPRKMPAKAGKTGKDRKSKGSKAKAKRKRQESPPCDWDHVPMPDKKDSEDPEGPDSYGKALTGLFQIACAELRQRY